MSLRVLALCLLVTPLLACGGGQRFAMLITSTPDDALVYVNDYPRGVTPVRVPYLYIGTYRIQMQHEGYEEIDELIEIRKPWYNWIPFMSLALDSLPWTVDHSIHIHRAMVAEPVEEF
jgi:hypothetical protein